MLGPLHLLYRGAHHLKVGRALLRVLSSSDAQNSSSLVAVFLHHRCCWHGSWSEGIPSLRCVPVKHDHSERGALPVPIRQCRIVRASQAQACERSVSSSGFGFPPLCDFFCSFLASQPVLRVIDPLGPPCHLDPESQCQRGPEWACLYWWSLQESALVDEPGRNIKALLRGTLDQVQQAHSNTPCCQCRQQLSVHRKVWHVSTAHGEGPYLCRSADNHPARIQQVNQNTRIICRVKKPHKVMCNHEWLSHPQGGAIKDDLREQRDQKTRSPPLEQRPKPQKKAKERRTPRPKEDFRNIMVLHIPRRSP